MDDIEDTGDTIDIQDSVLASDDDQFLTNYDTKKKSYKTTPVLTKYERTRVIGERANQIINGSKPFISNYDKYGNPYEIALVELQQKKIPFVVKRPYGNTFEYWKLEDLL